MRRDVGQLERLHRLREAACGLLTVGTERGRGVHGVQKVPDVAQVRVARSPSPGGEAGGVERVLRYVMGMRAPISREVVVAFPSEDADVADVARVRGAVLKQDAGRGELQSRQGILPDVSGSRVVQGWHHEPVVTRHREQGGDE